MSIPSTSSFVPSKDVLRNNPFVAPPDGRCIINNLPAELLSQIFVHGVESEQGDGSSNDDASEGSCESISELDSDDGSHSSHGSHQSFDSEDERRLPFELLVTRICKRWRDVASGEPSLWSTIVFIPDTKIDKVKEYVRRAKGAPLDLTIDCTVDDDVDEEWRWETESSAAQQQETTALVEVLNILMPHVGHWKSFVLSVSYYFPMLYALQTFAKCEGAPMLEALALYHYEDSDDIDEFHPTQYKDRAFVLFHNNLPKLRQVALWGVHIDWKKSTFLKNLHELELAYHTLDVRPGYKEFLRMLETSPQLQTLTLCQSGPAGMPVEWLASVQENSGSNGIPDSFYSVTLPSVENLVLAFLPPDYVIALLDRMHMPNVTSLALDFEDDEYRPVLDRLCEAGPGNSKPLLASVEALKLSGLPCSHYMSVVHAAELLVNLKQLSINFDYVGPAWQSLLGSTLLPDGKHTDALNVPGTPFFPRLEAISVTGLTGESVRDLVFRRKAIGKPLKEVYVNKDDEIEAEDEEWLKENVEVFELFEGSDDEDIGDDLDDVLDLDDVDEDDVVEDDEDDAWEDDDNFEYDSDTGVGFYFG